MSPMLNQIRSTVYLLSRDAYLKGAVVLPVLVTVVALGVPALATMNGTGTMMVSWSSLARTLLSVGVVFGTAFAMTGLVTHDTATRGLRAACLAERGRGRYVASRLLAAGAMALALAAWSSLLALVGGLLPGVSDCSSLMVPSTAGGPASLGELVPWALVAALVGWAYAAVGMLLVWAREDGLGFLGVCVLTFLLVSGILESLLSTLALIVCATLAADPTVQLGLFVSCLPSGAWAMGALPLVSGDSARAALVLVVPLVWVALGGALSWARLARRNL